MAVSRVERPAALLAVLTVAVLTRERWRGQLQKQWLRFELSRLASQHSQGIFAPVSFNGNYTYSKAIDDLSDLFNNGAGARPTDNENHSYDKGPADFDTRHRFVATVTYELPFMKNNRWLGGWGVNSIISYQTGHPWTPFGGNSGAADKNQDGYRTDRILPNDHGVPTGSISSTEISGSPADGMLDRSKWGFKPHINTFSYFTCPASENGGAWCNVPIGQNSVFGPSATNVNINFTKRFRITENSGFDVPSELLRCFQSPEFPESIGWERG